MSLYLIKRGPKPEYHRAPFHPVILCNHKTVARWEVGWTGDQAWLWSREGSTDSRGGWLIERWNGLDIDYGHLVRGHTLPDGSHSAFWRDYHPWPAGIQDLFAGAVWWSLGKLPEWLAQRGVIYPPDAFTRTHIVDLYESDVHQRGGLFGVERRELWPAWWPPAEPPLVGS